MKHTALKFLAGLGILALIPTVAMAHTDVSIGLGLGGYYAPEYAYEAPPPVYCEQPVRYYGDRVAYGYRDEDRHEWRHDHGYRHEYRADDHWNRDNGYRHNNRDDQRGHGWQGHRGDD